MEDRKHRAKTRWNRQSSSTDNPENSCVIYQEKYEPAQQRPDPHDEQHDTCNSDFCHSKAENCEWFPGVTERFPQNPKEADHTYVGYLSMLASSGVIDGDLQQRHRLSLVIDPVKNRRDWTLLQRLCTKSWRLARFTFSVGLQANATGQTTATRGRQLPVSPSGSRQWWSQTWTRFSSSGFSKFHSNFENSYRHFPPLHDRDNLRHQQRRNPGQRQLWGLGYLSSEDHNIHFNNQANKWHHNNQRI